MRRLSFLLAGGALWLFLTAVPALADGGPHLTSVNSGTSTLTADSCAGCHRAHTSQSQYLLKAASEELLCLSCHGAGGTLATVDVELGLQYVPAGNGTRTGTVLGALRDGGFLEARIDSGDPSRLSYIRGYEDSPFNTVYAISTKPKVGVLGAANGTPVSASLLNVNSAHIDLADAAGNGIADTHTLWGKGNSGLGTAQVSLTCVECHNPHGNNQYRILRPVPGVEADPLGESLPVTVKAAYANFNTIVTAGQHGLAVGDKVVIDGLNDIVRTVTDVSVGGVFTTSAAHGFVVGQTIHIASPLPATTDDIPGYPDGAYVIASVPATTTFTLTTGTPGTASTGLSGYTATADFTGETYYVGSVTNGFTFKVAPSLALIGTTINVANFSGAGSVTRPEVTIADVNPDPDGDESYPTKNYTVIQTKGSQGVDSTYLLYARDVLAARAGNGVAQDQPSVAITSALTNGTPAVYYFQTTGAHGLAVGDLVTIAGTPGGLANGTYTVGAVRSSGTVYDQFSLVGQTFTTGATTGTVVRQGIDGDYSATGGDYFRRTIPWDPSINNPNCKNNVYSSDNSAQCGTANDAPNGRPATITSGPSALIGQQAFLDQMSTWCSQCHTRYYSNSNENVANQEPITAISDRGIGRTLSTGEIYPLYYVPTSSQFGGPSYGDKVTFTGMPQATLNSGTWYVVATGSTSGRSWFKVSSTQGGAAQALTNAGTGSNYDVSIGTFTRTYQSSNSSWGYPRVDSTYKYQHSTASNRACVVCHVSHGSNAVMTGPDSLAVPYPDGTTTSTSSRLLKVDNRGTCQMCHDPTGTVDPGTYLPLSGYSVSVP